MRIGLLSDTHGYLDPRVYDLLKDCNEIWHAGDFGDGVSDPLKSFKPLRGVFGNIDGQKIRSEFPERLFFEMDGLKVLMIHIGGPPSSYFPFSRQSIELLRPDIFICGHSHILKVVQDKKYHLLYINPGAAGKQGFHKMRTLIRFETNAKKIKNLEVIELGLRGIID